MVLDLVRGEVSRECIRGVKGIRGWIIECVTLQRVSHHYPRMCHYYPMVCSASEGVLHIRRCVSIERVCCAMYLERQKDATMTMHRNKHHMVEWKMKRMMMMMMLTMHYCLYQ